MAETKDDPLGQVRAMNALRFLANEMNGSILGWRVSLEYYELQDYLAFEREDDVIPPPGGARDAAIAVGMDAIAEGILAKSRECGADSLFIMPRKPGKDQEVVFVTSEEAARC